MVQKHEYMAGWPLNTTCPVFERALFVKIPLFAQKTVRINSF